MPSSSSTPLYIHSNDYASPALLELFELDITRPVVDYIVQSVVDAVDEGRSCHTGHRVRRGRLFSRLRPEQIKFTQFVSNVLTQSKATMPLVLMTLAYVDRVRPRLRIICEDWALERVFLGALMVARKYTCDSNYRCRHWAVFSGVFGTGDIRRIEREFLEVIRFDLQVSEAELLAHHDSLAKDERQHPSYTDFPHHSHFKSRPLTTSSFVDPSGFECTVPTPELTSAFSPDSDASSVSPATPNTPEHHVHVVPVSNTSITKPAGPRPRKSAFFEVWRSIQPPSLAIEQH